MNNERKYKFMPQKETGRLSESDTKKYYSTIGFAVTAFLLATYGSVLVVSTVCRQWFPWVLENEILSNLISVICQYGIGTLALLAVLKKLPKDANPKEKLKFGQFMGFFCVCSTFMLVGSNISSSLMGIVEIWLDKDVVNPVVSSTSGTHWAINLVFYAILAPIIEEIVFRKIVCDHLLPLGEMSAIVISAAIFGLIHGNFYQFFYAFLVGAIFSYVYIKTGSLLYTTVIHIIINLFGGVISPWAIDAITEEGLMQVLESIINVDFYANSEHLKYNIYVSDENNTE